MYLSFDIGETTYRFDTRRPIDISIPLDFYGEQPEAFGIPRASAAFIDAGGFVGDTRRGGSCNCETVTLNPHGNGTHTEGVGHISDQRLGIATLLRQSLVPAVLVSVDVSDAVADGSDDGGLATGDRVVTADAIRAALRVLPHVPSHFYRGLVLRTLPNGPEKRRVGHSGKNPPYLTSAAIRLVRELDVLHFLVDLPSVDREDDGGALSGHRIFWGVEPGVREIPEPYSSRTITEMIFVDEMIPDGLYMLDLQIPAFQLDAAPSRPMLYAVSLS
jgi:arylformamidase